MKYQVPNKILSYILKQHSEYIKTDKMVKDSIVPNKMNAGNHFRRMHDLGLCEYWSKTKKGTCWLMFLDKLKEYAKTKEETRPCKWCGEDAVYTVDENGSEWCKCECTTRVADEFGG